MFCFYDTSHPDQFNYKFDDILLTITLSKHNDWRKLAEETNKFDYEVCLKTAVNLEASELYKIQLSYSGPIEYKQIDIVTELQKTSYSRPAHAHPNTFTALTESTVI